MAIAVTIRLRSIEDYVLQQHGRPRGLDISEIRVVQRHLREIVVTLAMAWPVDTGFSRDQWTGSTSLSAAPYTISVENEAFYSQWVHRAGGTPEAPLWEQLVPQVVGDQMPALMRELRATIDQTEARIRSDQGPITRGLIRSVQRAQAGARA